MNSDSDENETEGCMPTNEFSKLWSCDQFSIESNSAVQSIQTCEYDWTCTWDEIAIVRTPITVHGGFADGPQRRVDMLPNTFSMMPTDTRTKTICAGSALSVYTRFSKDLRQEFLAAHPQSSAIDEPRTALQQLRNASAHTALINAFLDADGYGGRLLAENLLMLLIGDAYQSLSDEMVAKPSACLSASQLAMLTEYIDSHLDAQLNTETLAALVGSSPFHFARLFKATTGLPPHKFVVKHRIEKAKSMLQSTSKSIAEVAYEVGFSSQSHMTTAFKNEVGKTPKKFRLTTSG